MNKREFLDLAEEMEASCEGWEAQEGLSKESLRKLRTAVEAMDRKERKTGHFRLKKRYIAVLAAALILLMGMGTMGSRAWISRSNDLERDSEMTTKVNNEEKESVLREEEEIYQEISQKLGIAPLRMGYKPEGMELYKYAVMEGTGRAVISYLYQENLISVQMLKGTKEVSGNIQWDGAIRKLDDISNRYADSITAYCMDAENGSYTADITYGNAYYSVSGNFEEAEFLKILEEIYFKN